MTAAGSAKVRIFRKGLWWGSNSAQSGKTENLHIGTVSNLDGIGARIEVMTSLGMEIHDVRAGEGFCYMISTMAHFRLGAAEEITEVIVRWPSGIVDHVLALTINGTLMVEVGAYPVVLQRR